MTTVFVEMMLSAVAVGFLTWAGVVWRQGRAVAEALRQTAELLSRIDERVTAMRERIACHERLDWHKGAGLAITRLEARVDEIRRRMDEHNHGGD